MTKLNDGSPLVIRFDSEGDHWQVVFDRNDDFGVTGGGDAQRIFATVLSAIGQFVKEHEPQSLTFSADKNDDPESANPESRAKLYNRLVQRYASSVGYKTHSREQGDEVIYMLRPNVAVDEDYGPNDPPPGPESKPTMPAGTVKVDVSDVYDWYKLGQHISNLKGLGKHDFGQGPPSTIISFGSEEEEHKYIKDLEKTGLTTTDIDPVDVNQPPGMKRQKVDPTYNVDENFADGKGPGRPGDSQRHGIPKGATMAQLEKAAKAPGRKGQLARWQINMRRGKKK
jgi:hypothetical protein